MEAQDAIDFWEYQLLGPGTCLSFVLLDQHGEPAGILEATADGASISKYEHRRASTCFTKTVSPSGRDSFRSVVTGKYLGFSKRSLVSFLRRTFCATNEAASVVRIEKTHQKAVYLFDETVGGYWKAQDDGSMGNCAKPEEASLFALVPVDGFMAVKLAAVVRIIEKRDTILSGEDLGELVVLSKSSIANRAALELSSTDFGIIAPEKNVSAEGSDTKPSADGMIFLTATLANLQRFSEELTIQLLPPPRVPRRWVASSLRVSISWDNSTWFDVQEWRSDAFLASIRPSDVVSLRLAPLLTATTSAPDVFRLLRVSPHPFYEVTAFSLLGGNAFRRKVTQSIAAYYERVAQEVLQKCSAHGINGPQAEKRAKSAIRARQSLVERALDEEYWTGGYWGPILARRRALVNDYAAITSWWGDSSALNACEIDRLEQLVAAAGIKIEPCDFETASDSNNSLEVKRTAVLAAIQRFTSQNWWRRVGITAVGGTLFLTSFALAGPVVGLLGGLIPEAVSGVVLVNELTFGVLVSELGGGLIAGTVTSTGVAGATIGCLSATPTWSEFGRQAAAKVTTGAAFRLVTGPFEEIFEAADWAWEVQATADALSTGAGAGFATLTSNYMANAPADANFCRSLLAGAVMGVTSVGCADVGEQFQGWSQKLLPGLLSDVHDTLADLLPPIEDLVTSETFEEKAGELVNGLLGETGGLLEEVADHCLEPIDERTEDPSSLPLP